MIAVLPAREWVSMDDVVLGTPADLPGLLERVVVPVVRTLFPDESIDGIALAWEGDPPSRGRSDLLQRVRAGHGRDRTRHVVQRTGLVKLGPT